MKRLALFVAIGCLIAGSVAAQSVQQPPYNVIDVNHLAVPNGGSQGSTSLTQGDYVVIARNGITFKVKNGTGGTSAQACATNQWVMGVSSIGVINCTQPSFANISGTLSPSQVPASVLTIGTSLSRASPFVAGDTTTGIYTPAAAQVGITISSTSAMTIGTQGMILGAATGGYKGAGTLNMTGCFINGVACSGGGGSGITALTGDVVATGTGSVAATVARINGVALGTTTATSGNLLIGNGTLWNSTTVSGDLTIGSTGAAALAISGVTAGSYTLSSVTVNSKGLVTSISNGSAGSGTITGIITTSPLTGGPVTSGTATIACGTCGVTGSPLSQFASTTSAQLAGIISDETGTGAAVFGTSPTFTTGLTSPLIIGGTGVTSTLTLESTTGIGTTDSIIFKTGSQVTAASIGTAGITVGAPLGIPLGTGYVNAQGFQVNGSAAGAINQLFYQTNVALPNWRAAIERVMSRNGDARLLCMGDSTTIGSFSNGGVTNTKKLSYCGQLTSMLNANGIPAISENFIGDGGTGAAESKTYDTSRLTVGSGWSQFTLTNTLGGAWITATATTGNLAFTPLVPVNTCDFYWPQVLTAGVMSYNVDGGSNSTVNENVAGTLQKTTVALGDLKYHTMNFNYSSGGIVFWAGIDCYNSKINQVHVLNAGWPGAKSGDLNNTSQNYSPNASGTATTWAPDLTLLDIGINDWNQSISTTTYGTNVNALVTNWQRSGASDVVLVTPIPSNPSFAGISNATQLTYVAKMYAASQALGAPIIDMFNTFVSYAVASTKGYMAADGVHGTGVGYGDFSRSSAQILVPVNGNGNLLVCTVGNCSVGLGTTSAKNMLDVYGGMSIGTSYAGVTAAPLDGVIISGQVAIGTPSIDVSISNEIYTNSTNTPLEISNGNATSYANFFLKATGNTYNLGVAGASEVIFGVANKFFIFDNGASAMRLVLDTSGNIGIGTTAIASKFAVNGNVAIGTQYGGTNLSAPSNGLIVSGNVGIGTATPAGQFAIGNAAAHAGQTTCWAASGQIGYCTSVVGAGGACTCTGL